MDLKPTTPNTNADTSPANPAPIATAWSMPETPAPPAVSEPVVAASAPQPQYSAPQPVVSYTEPEFTAPTPTPQFSAPTPIKTYAIPADQSIGASVDLNPQPVVHVLSPRGVEYVFLTIALFTGTIGLITALVSLVNGQFGFDVLSFPVSLLIVAVPVFSWLFLRLKNAELRDPSLALDASKRRSTQVIQIVMFMVCFFTLIGFVGTVMASMSGALSTSLVKIVLDVLSILVVAGGVLFYYWRDEHKSK